MGLHCFKKHILPTNFHGNRNEEYKKFSMVKECGSKCGSSSIQVLIFVFVCVVFLTSLFLFFRGISIISSVRYFFVEAYWFKIICHMEIFVISYLPK